MLIHEFYDRQTSNPVHLLIDTSLPNAKLEIKAFTRFADCVFQWLMYFQFSKT